MYVPVCIFYDLPSRVRQSAARSMAKEEGDDVLPDKDAAKGFYAKYEPKEILGRCVATLYIAFHIAIIKLRAQHFRQRSRIIVVLCVAPVILAS